MVELRISPRSHMTHMIRHTVTAFALTLSACGLFEAIEPPAAAGDAGVDVATPDVDTDDGVSACARDERVVSGECVPCAPGTGRAPGDDPTEDDTRCDPITCQENEYVLQNACTACPAGQINDAGDFAIGDDSACEDALCGEDERVQGAECVACPPGTTNAPGDNATAGDTACEAIICTADHRVSENTCVACGLGATRPMGDDASGPDTLCEDACEGALGVTCAEFAAGYLKASNTGADDRFGYVLAASGDRIAVSALLEDSAPGAADAADDSTPDSGAVYIFRKTGTSWEQEAFIKPKLVEAGDAFGSSIALDGDTLAVGAKGDDSPGTYAQNDPTSNTTTDSGAVYVFEREGDGSWEQVAFLKAGVERSAEEFGYAVALEDGRLIVSAPNDDSSSRGLGGAPESGGVLNSGAVYSFLRTTTGTWKRESYIKANYPGAQDHFGRSVAFAKGVLVIGAPGEDSSVPEIDRASTNNAAIDSGAVYVLTRSDMGWMTPHYLKAEVIDAGDEFGGVVAAGEGFIAVGARNEGSAMPPGGSNPVDDSAPDAGAVYVFASGPVGWQQTDFLKAHNAGAGDHFGSSLAACGRFLHVGATSEDGSGALLSSNPNDDGRSSSGAVYTFDQGSTGWEGFAFIKASNPGSGDVFGSSLACEGSRLVVGARGESSASDEIDTGQDNNAAPEAGAAYVFELP